MSFDQRLITKNGFFAPCWIAGTYSGSLLKIYKRHQIETVNVGLICDKLSLATIQMNNELKQHLNNTSEDVHSESLNIPFRIVTNLCFGTLRIYQAQVASLYEESRILITCTKNALKTALVPKRKRSDFYYYTSAVNSKKRRISLSTDDGLLPITNSLELLKESECLAQFAENQESVTEEQFYNTSYSRKDQLIQIREITIREINTEVCVTEFDEENGFGNATNEELIEFLNFSADNSTFKVDVKDALKRKALPATEICIENKIAKFDNDDLDIEVARCCAGATDEVIALPQLACESDIKSYLNQSTENSENFDLIQLNEVKTLDDIIQININTSSMDQSSYNRNVNEVTSKNLPNGTITNELSLQRSCATNLIIDKSIMINEAEMRAQFKNYAKLQRRDILGIKLTRKHHATSAELLKRLNHHKSFCAKSLFKQHRKISNIQRVQSEYRNLLNDILGCYVDNDLANEIYPQWNKASFRNNKNKRKSKNTEIQKHCLEKENTALNSSEILEINNICEFSALLPQQTTSTSINEEHGVLNSINSTNKEWQPYGVMLKLLELLRYTNAEEIEAKCIFEMAKSRIHAALTFSSLLTLAAKDFIKISRLEKTNEMHKIKLGKASKNVLSDAAIQTRNRCKA